MTIYHDQKKTVFHLDPKVTTKLTNRISNNRSINPEKDQLISAIKNAQIDSWESLPESLDNKDLENIIIKNQSLFKTEESNERYFQASKSPSSTRGSSPTEISFPFSKGK